MMKRIISYLLIFVMFISNTANAQSTLPQIQTPVGEQQQDAVIFPIKKGQTAPFTGVLLSPAAIAKIIVDYNNQSSQTALEVNLAREKQKAQDLLLIENLTANLKYEKETAEAQIKSRNDQLKILNDRIAQIEKSAPNTLLVASLGAAAGALVIVLSFVAVNAAK